MKGRVAVAAAVERERAAKALPDHCGVAHCARVSLSTTAGVVLTTTMPPSLLLLLPFLLGAIQVHATPSPAAEAAAVAENPAPDTKTGVPPSALALEGQAPVGTAGGKKVKGR